MAIRKGSFYSGLDVLARLKQDVFLVESFRDQYRLEALSNTSLQVFIFSTTVLLSLLQVLPPLGFKVSQLVLFALLLMYSITIIVSQFICYRKRRKTDKEIKNRQDEFVTRVDKQQEDLRKGELQDELFGHLVELKILKELAEEVVEEAEKSEIDEHKDFEEELTAIIDMADSLHEEIRRKRIELHNLSK